MKFEFTAAVLAACIASQANAWWGTPHLLVAQIAQQILEDEAPNSYQASLDDLQTLLDSNPTLVDNEENWPFTECATWADDLKGKGYSFTSNWHFIDQPLMLDDSDYSDSSFSMSDTDVARAIFFLQLWLQDTGMYELSTYYTQLIDTLDSDDEGRSFALRLLIHFVGDIHQPLHATSGISEEYSKGDAGGNYEHLTDYDSCGATNLHAVWDSAIYNYCGYPSLPLSDDDYQNLQNIASDLISEYSFPEDEWYPGQIQIWASEAYDLANEYVYPNVVTGQSLSAEYKAAAEPVALKQIVKGGRRLAEMIKLIYPNDSTSAFL